MIGLHTLTVTVGPERLPVQAEEGQLTLTERRSPYASARFTIVEPTDPATVAALTALGGELHGTALVQYRDPVSAGDVTMWAGGAPVTVADITVKLAGGPLSRGTEALSAWANDYEIASERINFDLIIVTSAPNDEGQYVLEAEGLELRLIDWAPPVDRATFPSGTRLEAVVTAALQAVNPAWTLAPSLVPSSVETTKADVPWPAGLPPWDMLTPILQAAGMHLQCSADGRWRLYPAGDYDVSRHAFYLEGVTRFRTRETRDDWADAVLIRYRWRDSAGVDRAVNSYATSTPNPTKVEVVDESLPYPGSDDAAYWILQRRQKAGIPADITAVARYSVTPPPDSWTWSEDIDRALRPGTFLTYFDPDGHRFDGRIVDVTFSWPSNTMAITANSVTS